MIDLLHAPRPWTEAEISARTEAMVREHYSLHAEVILLRKAVGHLLGRYTLSPEDVTEMDAFQSALLAAQAAGESARADNALLAEAYAVETGEALPEEVSAPAATLRAERLAARAADYRP